MIKIYTEKIIKILFIFLAIELLSLISFGWPIVGQISFVIIALSMVVISIHKLEYGFLIVLAELFIGSMGHLFKLEVFGLSIPIRIMLWTILMLIFCLNLIKQLFRHGKKSIYWQNLTNFSQKKYFLCLAFFVILGIIIAFINHHNKSLIFSDVNAWLYYFLLGPVLVIYSDNDDKKKSNLIYIFLAGAIWLCLKTLFLLFIFTHNIESASVIYLWLRRTLVGEMTPTKSGWPRIFIQGQVYTAIAYLYAFWLNCGTSIYKKSANKIKFKNILISALFLSAVILSFSRSFWLSLALVLAVLLIYIWRKQGFLIFLKSIVWGISSAFLSLIIIYLIVNFPYIHLNSNNLGATLLDRVSDSNEAALSSRWSLLPVLSKEVLREPLFGQGYGATVTYTSYDPRVLEKDPSGKYTSYAFEWGYLDIALKIGLVGLAAYLLLLSKLIFDAWKKDSELKENYLFIPLASSLLFLAVVNIFTPYLNHPLGIGWIVISSCLIWRSRVY